MSARTVFPVYAIVEATSVDFWLKCVSLRGTVIGMTTFGASAPINDLYR